MVVNRAMDTSRLERGESGILVICIDKEINEVLHTLAHEFSHLMQWYEDDPLYIAWDKNDNEANNIKLEENAEKRALQLLEEWDILDKDAEERSAKYLCSLRKNNETQ